MQPQPTPAPGDLKDPCSPSLQSSSDQDFIIIQSMSLQQLQHLHLQRIQHLTRFYHTNMKYQICSWYDELKEYTFKSKKIMLKKIEGYLIYWGYYNDKGKENQKMTEEMTKYYEMFKKKIERFVEESCKEFENVNNDKMYQNQKKGNKGNKGNQCFMKLSTRSPKDFGYKYSWDQFQTISNELYLLLKSKINNQSNIKLDKQLCNQIYRFFLDLSKNKFKVTNFQDFFKIFSHSQRIIIDLGDFSFLDNQIFNDFTKDNYQKADDNFIQLWLREWKQFKWYEQFRCFYKDYKLTAISQYDQRCYFQEIQGKKQLIRGIISDFFEKLIQKLKKLEMSDGVMDIVLFNIGCNQYQQQNSKIHPLLIQINVFNTNSRASLFSWSQDIHILQGHSINNNINNNINNPTTTTTTNHKQIQIRIIQQIKQIKKDELLRLMGMIGIGTGQIIEKALKKIGLKKQWEEYE